MRITTNSKLEEQREHGREGFPFVLYDVDYRNYQDHTIGVHWHEEFEFNLVLSGEIEARIDGACYHLKAGDGIFINSNALHTTCSLSPKGDAMQYSVLFLPDFIAASNTSIFRTSIAPILLQSQLTAYPLYHTNEVHAAIINILHDIALLEKEKDRNTELELHINTCMLWMLLERLIVRSYEVKSPSYSAIHQERTKKMISYIQRNFRDKIVIDDIAACAGISRSECFRCFRNQVRKKPIEYLNEYRLEQAARELVMSSKSISEISQECGFDHQSYFGKQFKAMYHITPLAYRRQYNL